MRTGSAKALWLHILAEGPKDYREIAEEFPQIGNKARAVLHGMATKNGQLERTKIGRDRSRFSVTNDCAVPIGVTLAEVLEAMK